MTQTSRKWLALALGLGLVGSAACSDDSGNGGNGPGPIGAAVLTGNITSNRSLSSDTVYTLSGYVKVQSGVTLSIEPGTTIIGDSTVPGSSLWILRGGQINAQGTAAAPIVFTSAKAPGTRAPGDWGGIIIIGNGIINRTGTINTEGPVGVAEVYSGGANNADNSGTLRYVRIEFAGYDVSGGNASELNGLSLYAVGSGTTLEYIQTVSGLDDSFEWWGGAVDGRFLVSYESGDDHFDWSEGYVGRNQYLIAYQSQRLQPAPGAGTLSTDPQGIEADGCNGSGCTTGFRSTPFSDPTFANLTILGMGATETTASGGFGVVLRRGTKGLLANSIIANWKGIGLTVRDSVTGNLTTADSLNATDLVFAANTLDHDTVGANYGQASVFTADNHRTAASVAAILTNTTATSLNWTPLGTAAAGCGTVAIPAARTGAFFGGTLATTTFCGAVNPAGPLWYQGWTSYAAN